MLKNRIEEGVWDWLNPDFKALCLSTVAEIALEFFGKLSSYQDTDSWVNEVLSEFLKLDPMEFIHHKISSEEGLNDDGKEFMVAISERMRAVELTLEESSGSAATMKLRKMALDCSRLLYLTCKVVNWRESILDSDWQDEVEMAAIIKVGPLYEFKSILKIASGYKFHEDL